MSLSIGNGPYRSNFTLAVIVNLMAENVTQVGNQEQAFLAISSLFFLCMSQFLFCF